MSTPTTNFGWIKPAVNSVTDQDQWGTELNTDLDSIDSECATRTLDYDFAGYQLKHAKILYASEALNNIGSIGAGTLTVDYSLGNYQYGVLGGNVSGLTISNYPASGVVGFLTLELIQDGTGGRTLTLSNTVYKTQNGQAITLTTTANAIDKLRLETRDGGSTWFVSQNANIKFVP